MSLVKCQECGDIIESTDQKACIRHAKHHGKNYKEICWEIPYEEELDALPKNETRYSDTVIS